MKPGVRTNGPASLELVRMVGFEDQNLLEVKSVRTEPESRNKGHAGQLLAKVCKEADESRTLLVLTPEPYDDGPLDSSRLQSLYAVHGFSWIQHDPVLMCRDPRPVVTIKHVPFDRRYDIATDSFGGPKATVEIRGAEHKAQIAGGMDAKDWAERVVTEVLE